VRKRNVGVSNSDAIAPDQPERGRRASPPPEARSPPPGPPPVVITGEDADEGRKTLLRGILQAVEGGLLSSLSGDGAKFTVPVPQLSS
jgi:hypothetical protein